MNNLFSIAGKVAIVTGGSRGIGEMIARGFVENGARVYITARKAEECLATAERLSEFGECIAIPGDLSTLSGITELVSTFSAQESQLDILVNNAGATWGAALHEFPEGGWDKVMDLNLKSPFFLIQQLLEKLQQSASAENPARIINIASINGLTHPGVENYSYSASKAGLIHLTRHLCTTLASEQINVNAIAPGFFPTKMMAHADIDAIAKSIPKGRAGQPDDAAGAAIFLASKASAWITGVTLPVDGGLVASA
ncbi:SDR family oxidoreductase [Porticoccaceae bacterium]|nr:SDR family oxidoreductase [Porticoccaceae bacterium]